MTGETGNGNGNGSALAGAGPFPEGVNCGTCAFGVRQQATDEQGQPMIGHSLIHCMRFPPTMVFRILPNGAAQFGPMYPILPEAFACFSHSTYDVEPEENEE